MAEIYQVSSQTENVESMCKTIIRELQIKLFCQYYILCLNIGTH